MLWLLWVGCSSNWDLVSDLDQDGYTISEGDCNDLNAKYTFCIDFGANLLVLFISYA